MQIKILPRVDSRSKQFSFAQYGQVIAFTDEYNVDSPITDSIQPSGDVRCTCYSICGVMEDKENRSFDIEDLFKRIPSNTNGADPITAIKEGRDKGLKQVGYYTRETPYKAFFEAHTGNLDAFDNVRSALVLCKYSVMVWGKWYFMWGISSILTQETDFNSYHAIQIKGWTQKWGEPMLIINSHVGRPMYMKRSVFNEWAKTWGFGSAVLATTEIAKARQKTLMESVIDVMKNFVIQLQVQIKKKDMRKDIYETAKSLLGRHLTLDQDVPKSVGCGQAFSFLMKACGYPIPRNGIAGTIGCNEWLKDNAVEISEPEQGAIIVSITEGNTHGHIGCIAKYDYMFPDDWGIMSNDSDSGLWEVNWDYTNWRNYYSYKLGLQTKYYKL